MDNIVYEEELVTEEVFEGDLILDGHMTLQEQNDYIFQMMRDAGIEVGNKSEYRIGYTGAEDNDGISETQYSHFVVTRTYKKQVPYREKREEVYNGVWILDGLRMTPEQQRQKILDMMSAEGVSIEKPEELEIGYTGAEDDNGISETQSTRFVVYRVTRERLTEAEQQELDKESDLQNIYNELVTLGERLRITTSEPEIAEISEKIAELSSKMDELVADSSRDYGPFEEALRELEAQIQELSARIQEYNQEYNESYIRIKELLDEYSSLVKGDPTGYDQRIRELIEQTRAENEQSLEIRTKILQQTEELNKLLKKQKRLRKDFELAQELGISAMEYKEIADSIKKRKLIAAIIEKKGLSDLMSIPAQERTPEQRRQIRAIRQEILEELAKARKEKSDASILDLVEALYGIETEVQLRGKQRVLIIKPSSLETIKKNISKMPEKIAVNEEINKDYKPGEAPEDMKEVMDRRTDEVHNVIDRFVFFRDARYPDKLFARKNVFERFDIEPIGTGVRINGALCFEISREDAESIAANQDNDYSPYIVRYDDITIEGELEIESGKAKTKQTGEETTRRGEIDPSEESDELIPGTNFKRPRYRLPDESDEDYVAFLQSYYGRIFGTAQDSLASTDTPSGETGTDGGTPPTDDDELSHDTGKGPYTKKPIPSKTDETNEEEEQTDREEDDRTERRVTRERFTIFRDIDDPDRLYARRFVFERFDIEPIGDGIRVAGALCFPIDPADVAELEANQDNDYSPYYIEYTDIRLARSHTDDDGLDRRDDGTDHSGDDTDHHDDDLDRGGDGLDHDGDDDSDHSDGDTDEDDNVDDRDRGDDGTDHDGDDDSDHSDGDTDEDDNVDDRDRGDDGTDYDGDDDSDHSDGDADEDDDEHDHDRDDDGSDHIGDDDSDHGDGDADEDDDDHDHDHGDDGDGSNGDGDADQDDDDHDHDYGGDGSDHDDGDGSNGDGDADQDDDDHDHDYGGDGDHSDDDSDHDGDGDADQDDDDKDKDDNQSGQELRTRVVIYRDVDTPNRFYAYKPVFDRFDAEPIGEEVRLEGIAGYEISAEDVQRIVDNQHNDYSPYEVEFRNISFKDKPDNVEYITLYVDENDNNQIYAPDAVLKKFGITPEGEPTDINGNPCHKISKDTDQIINNIAKMSKNPKLEVRYEKVKIKQIEQPTVKPHVEEILDKLTDGLDIRAKDAKHYQASNLRISRSFRDELHSGNFAYNIVHIVPAVLKAGVGLFRKLAGKLMTRSRAKEAMQTIEERLANLSEEELEVLFDEYKGSQLKTDMNNQINPLILDRLRQYGLQKVAELNQLIQQDYIALFALMGQIRALEEQIQQNGANAPTLENQRQLLMHEAATHARSIIENRKKANNILSSGVHGLEEDFKAVSTKLSYVGMRFGKDNDFDNELQHQLGTFGHNLNVALANGNDEEIVQNFMGLESCYYENTEIRGSIAGRRSVGSKYYSPLAEQFDYRDDPFIRDLFTTVAVTTAAISAINAIRVHQIESQRVLNDQQAQANTVNAQNQSTMNYVHQTGQQISGKRGTFQDGMEAQAEHDILTNADVRERAHLDSTDWHFNSVYRVTDDAGHAAYNQFGADVTSQINAVTSDYAQGLITQAEALQRMAQISNDAQTTLRQVVDNSLQILRPYSVRNPQFDLTAVEQSMDYIVNHPNAIADMNQAMVDVTNLADGLQGLQATPMVALSSLPSDMATTIIGAASAAALAAQVSSKMSQAHRKGRYGNEVTAMMDDYLYGDEGEQAEEQRNR